MKKTKVRIFSAVTLAALVLGGASGLTSCDEETGVNTLTYKWAGSEDTTSSKVELSLPESLVVSAKDTTYFNPYIVDLNSDGTYRFISSGGDALMESGEQGNLLAYWVPEGFTLYASARRADDGSPVTGIVASDGTITAPTVTERTDLIITLSAKSNDNLVNGEAQKNVKASVNLTVVPTGSIARNKDASYLVLSEEERNQITAEMETFGMEHGLTGIRYQTNGSSAIYRDRFSTPLLAANNYIPAYGWGTVQYGTISEPLEAESTEAYKMYYHSLLSTSGDLGTVNYLDSDQAAVSDLYSYMSASLWQYHLNEDYTATEQVGMLARGEPEPVNVDPETGLATKWKVKVWVGGETDDEARGVKAGLTFRSADSSSEYDGRVITLRDYLTPIKLMATGAVGWYRGDEAATATQGKTKLVGFSEFYQDTANAETVPTDEEFLDKVHVTLDETDNSITYEFEDGFDQTFAKYYLDQLWCNPMCEDFVGSLADGDVIEGAKLYGTSPAGKTPADTVLSVGPYMIEKYQTGSEVVFKKNDQWPFTTDKYGRTLYQIEGFHMRVDSALNTDREESMKQFEGGYTDSVSISTDTQWEKYGNDPRLKTVLPDGTFGLTFNRMDKALWDQYFGEGGIWYQAMNPDGSLTANKSVNPVLSNDNYFKALNLGFDREAFADAEHDQVTYEYFQPNQKVNPETNTFYNDTEEHEAAMHEVYGDSFDNISSAPSKAVQYMQDAIIEELDAGHVDLGTVSDPTNFGFSMSIMSTDNYYRQVNYWNEYLGNVFNEAVTSYVSNDGTNPLVEGGSPLVKFQVTQKEYSTDASGQNSLLSDVWAGVSDCQGVFSITGNSLDSIDYLDILSCNKIGGFELSFAVDTNVPSAYLEWDGQYWSYESLWWATAGSGVTIDENGRGSSQA